MFASAHRVTGPRDIEKFDTNDEDTLPALQQRLSPKMMLTRVTPKNYGSEAIGSVSVRRK